MTPKQAAFVREYLIDLNATQAAIRAGYSAHTAKSIGQENLTKPDVAAAVSAAQAKLAEKCGMTVEGHLLTLKELRDAALLAEKFSAAVTAEMARGKVSGFYVDRVEMDAKVRGTVNYKANIPQRK